MSRRDSGIVGPFRSLLAAQALGTLQGLAFWVVVARVVDAPEVGIAAAAITTQTLVGLLVTLGLGTHLMATLPGLEPGRQHLLLHRALVTVSVVGLLAGGLVVLLVGPTELGGSSLAAAVAHPADAVLMAVGVMAAGWAVVVDEATLGLRRSSLQVWRNVVASGLRFPLVVVLLLLGERDSTALQAAWVIPLVVSVAVTLLNVGRADRRGAPGLHDDVRRMLGPSMRHQGLNLSIAASTLAVPVVAAVLLVPADNAAFAIAWRVATVAFLPPYLVAVALFSHANALGPDEFRRSMGRTLPAALLISVVLSVGAWLLGRPGLWIFGEEYVDESYVLLALLVPAGIWMVVKDHLVAWWRSQQEFRLATGLALASVALEIGGAATGAVLAGPEGLAAGWLVGMALSALLGVRWLRRVLAGTPWEWPRWRTLRPSGRPTDRPAGERGGAPADDRGAARPAVVGAIAVVAVLALGAALVAGLGTLGQDQRDDGAAPSSTAAPSGTTVDPSAGDDPDEECRPRPAPLKVDLGLQVATGDPDDPLLAPERVSRLAALAARAGADVVSTDVGWEDVLPTAGARPRWEALDLFLDAAARADLDVRVELTGSPGWALDDVDSTPEARWRPPLSDAELGRWRDFVRLTMRHLDGRADYVEVWNEPDNDAYWTTGADPAAFARLLGATAPVVRRLAPEAQIITGGLAGNDIGYLGALYRALPEGEPPFDLVGVHPFSGSLPPDSRDSSARFEGPFGPYDLTFLGFEELHETMEAAGDTGSGLYLGEFGYSTAPLDGFPGTPDGRRAAYLTQAFELAACTPYVEALGWYYLHPTPWDPATWTLVDRQLRPNRTYQALAAWTRESR